MERDGDRLMSIEACIGELLALVSGPSRDSALAQLRKDRPSLYDPIVALLSFHDTEEMTLGVGSTHPVPDNARFAVPTPEHRYHDLGPVGRGGMGDVRRVFDRVLSRTVVMKTLREDRLDSTLLRARFVREARTHARLQHPGIVPVYDCGDLPDGRPFLTMMEVTGSTLDRAAFDDNWSLRSLLKAFRQVCAVVAFAHGSGVLHRDLKPSNIMVGPFGETFVLDWGLAKRIGAIEPAPEGVPTISLETDTLSRPGVLAGTPAYMAPEQAEGATTNVDERADVYALGAILYALLCRRDPFQGDAFSVLARVRRGSSVEPLPPDAPAELVAICEQAMARDPTDRFERAEEIGQAVAGWLDGAMARERALAVVEGALAKEAEVEGLRRAAGDLRNQSEQVLRGIAPWRPHGEKAAGWAHADRANRLERAASLLELQIDQSLHAALQIANDLPEAHAALAERYRSRHALAETARQEEQAAREEARVRTHAQRLPTGHPVEQMCTRYLRGDGALTLHTDPPGAEVLLYRYDLQDRKRVEVFEQALGTTPVRERSLPMGSYLCILRRPGHVDVRYPVEISRLHHWISMRPGDRGPTEIWLPPLGSLPADSIYVPAGWFHSGGDELARASQPFRRLWCDAFAIQRFPVTNAQYIPFLEDLVARGREEEALRYAPRERGSTPGAPGALIYARTPSGGFALQPDEEGDPWYPCNPVNMVDWQGAHAYVAWLAEQTGLPWRLPGELEWEKAARGVDGRTYPWGDYHDPSWCRMRRSMRGRDHGDWTSAEVDSYPVDTSPYGVRGMAGNVRDWCLDAEGRVFGDVVVTPELGRNVPGEFRMVRGGAWYSDDQHNRVCVRYEAEPGSRLPDLGFRGALVIPPARRFPTIGAE